MSYIHSNPWTDAAAYGSALGDKLAEALIYRKQAQQSQQAQAAYRGAELGLEQRRVASEEKQAGQKAQYENSLLEIRRQHEDQIMQYHQALEESRKEKGILGQQLGASMMAHRKAQEQQMEVEEAYKRELSKKVEGQTQHPNQGRELGDKLKMIGLLSDPTKAAMLQANSPEAFSWMTNQFGSGGGMGAAVTKQPSPAMPQQAAPQRRFRYDPASGQMIPLQ